LLQFIGNLFFLGCFAHRHTPAFRALLRHEAVKAPKGLLTGITCVEHGVHSFIFLVYRSNVNISTPGAAQSSAHPFLEESMKKLYRFYTLCLLLLLCVSLFCVQAFAVEDMWTAANRIIVDVYNKIAGISTVLAGLMSAVAVVGAKLSNNQHKVDQAWDWLRRIWIAWAVINGIGAFIAYVAPLFQGLATIQG
jgi:hypothetical protein